MSEPKRTPFAEQALRYFERLYEGRALPGGSALLRAIELTTFAGGRRLSREEARWVAQQLVERGRRGFLSTLWEMFVRPESASPDYDATQPGRKVGVVEGIANLLTTPQRALIAEVMSRTARGKEFGKESGKPSRVGDFAETYAKAPTWGSFLEAVAPGVPRALRQVVGIAGDVAIDPLILLSVLSKGGQASKALSRMLGIDAARAVESKSPLRVIGLLMHGVLDPSVTREAIRSGKSKGLRGVFEEIAQAHSVRKAVAERGLESAGEELTGAAAKELTRQRTLARHVPDIVDRALSLWKASKTVLNPPSFVRNFFQNFILRYIEGEAVDPARVSAAVARLLKDPERFKALWSETGERVQDVSEVAKTAGVPLMETFAGWYEGADRLAAVIMAEATGKSPREFMMNYGLIPETLELLRRRGIAPFIAWQYFAVPAVVRGAVDQPHRLKRVAQAVSAMQAEPEKKGEYVQVGNREIRTGAILPVNPADFGPEMSLLDPRQSPLVQLAIQASDLMQGKGYRPFGGGERRYGLEAVLAQARDFWLPPAVSYYLPGLVSPPEAEAGRRLPRERIDYLFGLLGIPTRPVDREADLRSATMERLDAERRRAGELRSLLGLSR